MDDKKRESMIAAMEACAWEGYSLESIHRCDLNTVEKFVKQHRIPIEPWRALGYRDMALFGGGKKGMLLAESFLYYSMNGKAGIWIDFNGLDDVRAEYNNVIARYADGRVLKADAGGCAAYFAKVLNRMIALLAEEKQEVSQPNCEQKPEPKAQKTSQKTVAETSAPAQAQKAEPVDLVQKKLEEAQAVLAAQQAELLRLQRELKNKNGKKLMPRLE